MGSETAFVGANRWCVCAFSLTVGGTVHSSVCKPGIPGSGIHHHAGIRVEPTQSLRTHELLWSLHVPGSVSPVGSARLLAAAREFRHRGSHGSVTGSFGHFVYVWATSVRKYHSTSRVLLYLHNLLLWTNSRPVCFWKGCQHSNIFGKLTEKQPLFSLAARIGNR